MMMNCLPTSPAMLPVINSGSWGTFLPLTHTVPSRLTTRSNTWTRRCDSGSVRAVSSTTTADCSGGARRLSPKTRYGAAEAAAVAG